MSDLTKTINQVIDRSYQRGYEDGFEKASIIARQAINQAEKITEEYQRFTEGVKKIYETK